MNEYQNAGEYCAFLQCEPCRGYPYVGRSQDIRSSSLHIYYYTVVLTNFAKFKGTQLHRSLFSTCNLQLYWKRDGGIYKRSVSFAKFFRRTFIMKNLLRIRFERRTLLKMVNRHSYYNKKISWSRHLFQKTNITWESVYLRTTDRKLTLNLIVIFKSFTDISFIKYITKIFYISYYFQEKI